MRFFVLFLAALLLPRVLAAQNVRGTTLVGNPAGDAVGPALDSDADLTALVYGDVQAGSLWIHTSDGRGVTWSAAGRVDDGTSAAYKYVYPDAVRVAGNRVYVYWTEARSGPSPARDVWFNWSGDGGVTFQPADLPVDKGLPTGGNDVKEVRMEVDPRDPTNPGDDVIVLLMRVEDDLAASDEHLYINWSVNSGLTFQAVAVAVSIHPMLGPVLVTEMDLALEGGVAYPAWIDNFLAYMGPDDCWMSALDTVTGTFLRQDVMVNAPYAGLFDVDDDVAVDVNNGILAVLWLRTPLPGPFVNELRSNVSPDGGVTWIGETGVGSYLPAVDDVNEPDVAVAGNGNILAAWHDNRFPPSYATWTAVSVNGGASWLQDLQLSVGACHPLWLRCPGLEAAAVWMAPDLTAPPHFVEAAMSLDAGLTWTPAFPVSGNSGDADRAGEDHHRRSQGESSLDHLQLSFPGSILRRNADAGIMPAPSAGVKLPSRDLAPPPAMN